MKKTYMQPTHEVVRIETAQAILAGSAELIGKDATGTGLAPEFDLDD